MPKNCSKNKIVSLKKLILPLKNKPSMKKQSAVIAPQKPFDDYFRAIFSVPAVARQLIEFIVPAATLATLDLDTLALAPDTFVDEQLKKNMADLVYVCNRKEGGKARICFLFEHKSRPPGRRIYPQVGRYLTNSQENDIRQKHEKFSLTVPIFFYHGATKWTPKKVRAQYEKLPKSLSRFALNFDFLVVNLSHMTREEIRGMNEHLLLRNIFLAMKQAWDDDFFRAHAQEIVIFAGENVSEEILMLLFDLTLRFIQYLSNFQKSEIMEIATALPPKYGKRAKTTYEYLIEEGMEKGMEKLLRAYILKFPNASNAEVADIFDVEIAFVQKIRATL